MSVCIALRDDYDSIQLRCLAKRSLDPRQVRRLLSLAAVYDGMSRTEGRESRRHGSSELARLGASLQRGRAGGLGEPFWRGPSPAVDGRADGRTVGDRRGGPDPEIDGVVRWRRIDLKRVIEERFGVIYSERAISGLLAALSFSHISGRPRHPKQDERVIEAFKKTSRARWRPT